MKTTETSAIAKLRAKLGVKRLAPRRLFMVDDGAHSWIGDRADLDASDARALRAVDLVGRRPDLADAADRAAAAAADYDAICGRVRALASTCGAGLVRMEELPEEWRRDRALGPIAPL